MLEAFERHGIIERANIITHLERLKREESKYPDARILDFFGSYILWVSKQWSAKPLYVLVDGIDECPEDVKIAETLARLATHSKSVRVLLTCGPERKIEEVLLNCLRIETTNQTFAPDRQRWVDWNLEQDERLKGVEPEIKQQIRTTLSTDNQV